MTLKEEFLEFVTNNPRSEQSYTTLPSGVDVEWNDKLKAWKVDMGIDVQEFLDKNPDIKRRLARKHRKLNLNKLSQISVVRIADDVLNELIKSTDVGVPTAWIGHRTRSVRGGSASGANKSARYERAAESGKLTGITGSWEKAEGGGIVVRPSSNKDRRFKNRQATLQGNRTYIDPDTGDEWGFEYEGAKSRSNRTARRASEQRGGSRELSQLAKEQKRRAQKAGLDIPLDKRDKELVQQLTNLTTDPNSPYYRYQVDHVYDMALYDEAFNPRLLGNTPEALQLLTRRDNIQKFQEGKALSTRLAEMEFTNPSRSMDPRTVQRAIGANPKLYSNVSKADAALQLGAGLATGDVATAAGGAAGLAMQSKPVQKLILERLAKTGGKLIPGVDVGLSAAEAASYAAQGRHLQAGIAGLSGAVGWIPGVGDLASAGLDISNTVIDIFTGNVGTPDINDVENPTSAKLRRNLGIKL